MIKIDYFVENNILYIFANGNICHIAENINENDIEHIVQKQEKLINEFII